jgi:prephenate dehydrogenase
MTSPAERRAHVIGLGLIGASVCLALRSRGWRGDGEDLNSDVMAGAVSTGICDRPDGGDLDVIVVATPASFVVQVARDWARSLTPAGVDCHRRGGSEGFDRRRHR